MAEGSPPANPLVLIESTLTPDDRLAVSSAAQEIARKVLPLKTPMRREVLRQVAWLLGEE